MQVKVIDCKSPTASVDFASGLKEIGFAVLENHMVDQDLINKVYDAWEKFFASEEKHEYPFKNETHDGFISYELSETAKGFEIKDLKEFYHYYTWGRCPEHLKALTQSLYDQLYQQAIQLLTWLEENLPQDIAAKLSEPLSSMVKDSPLSLFRLIHYPPLSGDEDPKALRAADHEDIDLLTVLPSATTKGLQVKDKDGNWLDVPFHKGWIVINAGDMLQEATDHYYKSTTHRVQNPTGEDAKIPRLSMPLFFHPRDEVKLSDRHTAHTYRMERYAELGLAMPAE